MFTTFHELADCVEDAVWRLKGRTLAVFFNLCLDSIHRVSEDTLRNLELSSIENRCGSVDEVVSTAHEVVKRGVVESLTDITYCLLYSIVLGRSFEVILPDPTMSKMLSEKVSNYTLSLGGVCGLASLTLPRLGCRVILPVTTPNPTVVNYLKHSSLVEVLYYEDILHTVASEVAPYFLHWVFEIETGLKVRFKSSIIVSRECCRFIASCDYMTLNFPLNVVSKFVNYLFERRGLDATVVSGFQVLNRALDPEVMSKLRTLLKLITDFSHSSRSHIHIELAYCSDFEVLKYVVKALPDIVCGIGFNEEELSEVAKCIGLNYGQDFTTMLIDVASSFLEGNVLYVTVHSPHFVISVSRSKELAKYLTTAAAVGNFGVALLNKPGNPSEVLTYCYNKGSYYIEKLRSVVEGLRRLGFSHIGSGIWVKGDTYVSTYLCMNVPLGRSVGRGDTFAVFEAIALSELLHGSRR